MPLHRIALALVAITAIAAGTFTATAAQAQRVTASDINKARPLTNSELHQIYNSRSWLWEAGAGHFSSKQRRFTAWSNEGGSPSYGIGQWFITGPGKLCFRATWHAANGTAPALTCFSHREKDGFIYQRREPSGEWYVFKSNPASRSDEWARLRHGDYVVPRLDRVKARIGRR
jgi:hypothetical protein